MTRSLRRAISLPWEGLALIVACIFIELVSFAIAQLTGFRPTLKGPLTLRDLFMLIGAVAYGIFRAVYFHPLFRTDYRLWLERSPWTWRDPLPAGPIHLVWSDGFVMAALALLGLLHERLHFLTPPLVFMTSYLAVLAGSFVLTGESRFAYAIALGLGLMIRLCPDPWAATVVTAFLYLIGLWGIRRSLARLPWPELADWEKLGVAFERQKLVDQVREQNVGWPFIWLNPTPTRNRISQRDGLLMSLLLGWWVYVIFALIPANIREMGSTVLGWLCLVFAIFAALLRAGVYCWGYLPPISLWGRIWTLRWIVPGYDHVLVAPICMVLLGAAGVQVSRVVDPLVIGPLTMTAILFTALTMGPSLDNWQMTGTHRIVPLLFPPQEFKKV